MLTSKCMHGMNQTEAVSFISLDIVSKIKYLALHVVEDSFSAIACFRNVS